MELQNYWQALMTESVNPRTLHIDTYTTADIVRCINEDDQMVALAVKDELPHVVQAVDLIYNQLHQGGRLFYVGAGTSGRLGVLDASECPPTFGVDPQMVQGIIAGGDAALRKAIEGAEDDATAGEALVEAYGMNANDVMVGITASGSFVSPSCCTSARMAPGAETQFRPTASTAPQAVMLRTSSAQ